MELRSNDGDDDMDNETHQRHPQTSIGHVSHEWTELVLHSLLQTQDCSARVLLEPVPLSSSVAPLMITHIDALIVIKHSELIPAQHDLLTRGQRGGGVGGLVDAGGW